MPDTEDSGLLAIEVDADDYADTAAADTPAVPRTYQSEAAFHAVKAAYSPKTHGVSAVGDTYDDLIAAVPRLAAGADGEDGAGGKPRLGKKDSQLLAYAVGEMYFDGRYAEVVGLCERVGERCEVEAKMGASLVRWAGRCRGRTGG